MCKRNLLNCHTSKILMILKASFFYANIISFFFLFLFCVYIGHEFHYPPGDINLKYSCIPITTIIAAEFPIPKWALIIRLLTCDVSQRKGLKVVWCLLKYTSACVSTPVPSHACVAFDPPDIHWWKSKEVLEMTQETE